MALDRSTLIPALTNVATRLRIDSVRSTTEAGSGHPTSCCSAADICRGAVLRRDAVRSEGPAPSAAAIASCCRRGTPRRCSTPRGPKPAPSIARELLKLREIGSDLEGHPTPRLPFVDVATGSLGQGICAAVGMRAERAPHRLGLPHLRARSATASRPKARCGKRPTSRRMDGLDNLCGITDVNGLGQSRPTMWQHDMEQFARRWRAFGWHAIVDRRPRPERDPRRVRRGARAPRASRR